MATNEALLLGVDIGGTKVAAGMVTARGKILSNVRRPMANSEDVAAGLESVHNAIAGALNADPARATRVKAIGLSSPGPLDPVRGVVLDPPNLPCWRSFPLAEKIAEAYQLPTRVDNDANAAALAEAVWGAGVGYASVFYATLGTGIGTGIILDGRIYHGRTGAAAEGGYVTIDRNGPRCGCGKRGCIEALASGPAVARRARELLAGGDSAPSKMRELSGGNLDALTAETVGAAWRLDDTLATHVLEEAAENLAIWLGSIVDLLEPDIIIFGGDFGGVLAEWFHHIRARLPGWSINSRCREIPLIRAKYEEHSGIAGAAALCLSVLRE